MDTATTAALCNALAHFEGAIIAVSHDESFVNTLMNRQSPSTGGAGSNTSGSGDSDNKGEIWTLSKKQLKRFDGTFSEYKKEIRKKLDSGVLEID